jgi:hypothetical protein
VLEALGEWIAATDASVMLQDAGFVVPLSQSLHIVGIAVLFASALMINLRLLGLGSQARSVSAVIATALPWMWRALLLCVVTGVLQTFIEPQRQFETSIYFWKLFLIGLLALLTRWLQRTSRSQGSTWDAETPPASARSFAVSSSIGWIVVIFFGRFIAYV